MYIPVFLFLILVACGNRQSSPAKSSTPITIQMDTSVYAVIPYTEKDRWLFQDAHPVQLTGEDITGIESLLKQATDERNKTREEKFRTQPLGRYRRQLVPVMNSKGEKEVFVNCFCRNDNSSFGREWRTRLLLIDGGGTCFFSIKINLSQKKAYELMVNGPI